MSGADWHESATVASGERADMFNSEKGALNGRLHATFSRPSFPERPLYETFDATH